MKNTNGLSVADILGKWPKTIMRSKSKQARTVAVVSSNKRPVIISFLNGRVSMRWADL